MRMRRMLTTAGMIVAVATTAAAAQYASIASLQAKALLDKGIVFLLDVRTPEEFRQAHLKGAVLIPIDQIEKRLGEIPKNRPILVYCAVGSRSKAVPGYLRYEGRDSGVAPQQPPYHALKNAHLRCWRVVNSSTY